MFASVALCKLLNEYRAMRSIYRLLSVWLVLVRVDQDTLNMATGHHFTTMRWARRLYSPVATIPVVVGVMIYVEEIRQSAAAFLFVPAAVAFVARAMLPDLTSRLLEREVYRCAHHADMKAQGAYLNAKLLLDDLGKRGQPLPVKGDVQRMQETLTNRVQKYRALKEDARAAIGGIVLRLTLRAWCLVS